MPPVHLKLKSTEEIIGMYILIAGIHVSLVLMALIRIRSLCGSGFYPTPWVTRLYFKMEVQIMRTNNKNLLILLAIFSMLLLTGNADAQSSYETAWGDLYPASTLVATYDCNLCHTTPYYSDIKNQLGGKIDVNSSTIKAAITDVEPLDSDGDTYTNIVEINSNTHPGIASSHPVFGIPAITDHSPTSPVSNIAGDERPFNISINQTVNVTWFINGSFVQFNQSTTAARYTNKSAAIGTWNVTAFVENGNGTDIQKWGWIVSPPPTGAPEITGHSPSSPVSNVAGDERTFNISVNQTVNVTWFINGSFVQFNQSMTAARYTNKSAAIGTWNVTAFVENDYGTDIQKWDWIVSPPQAGAPKIIGHSPSSPVSDVVGVRRTFNININRTANVSWYINGTRVQFNESVTAAKYTNTSAARGTWNVSAVAENDIGSDIQKWDWIVTFQSLDGKPKIISSYPEDILIYNNTGESRTFGITLDKIAKVSWYIYDLDMNGNKVQTDNDVSGSSYTNTGMPEGVWIVKAVAENAKGSDSKVWVWIVTPQVSERDIKADVEIKPETLNLASKGKITVSITLPRDYDAANIDVDNLTLEGAHPIDKPQKIKRNTLKVKFDRQDLENIPTGKHVALTVIGRVLHDGSWVTFEGRDTIRVIDNADDTDVVEEDDNDDDEANKIDDNDDDENEIIKDSMKEVKVNGKDSNEKQKEIKAKSKDKEEKQKKENNGKKVGKKSKKLDEEDREEEDD